MTALPYSFSRRTNTALVGIVIAASLGLAGCSGGSTEPVASQPATSPSDSVKPANTVPEPPPADSGVYEKPSKNTDGVFSNEDGFSVAFGSTDKNQLLTPDGGVSIFKDSSDRDTVSFTAYEKSGAGNWTVTLPEISGGIKSEQYNDIKLLELLRWEGKTYTVAYQQANVTTSASGLQAGTSVVAHNIYVIDMETGKIVNTVKAEKPADTSVASDVFIPAYSNKNNSEATAPFLNVVVTTGTVNGVGYYRAVHPLTGETLDEMPYSSEATPFFAGGEFKNAEIPEIMATLGFKASNFVNTFGEFVLVRSGNEIEVGIYDKAANIKHTLVDMKTGKSLSSMDCARVTNENVGNVDYSANFRYVAFDGNFIFDTETGKTFCGAKNGSRSGLAVYAIDNDGNMFGSNDSGKLLKVSIENNEVVELYDVASHDVPASFTSEGLGVFPSGKTTVLLPLKK